MASLTSSLFAHLGQLFAHRKQCPQLNRKSLSVLVSWVSAFARRTEIRVRDCSQVVLVADHLLVCLIKEPTTPSPHLGGSASGSGNNLQYRSFSRSCLLGDAVAVSTLDSWMYPRTRLQSEVCVSRSAGYLVTRATQINKHRRLLTGVRVLCCCGAVRLRMLPCITGACPW